jgi:predicted nucleic acid-binding protein
MATPPSEVAIPAVVVYELEAGIEQSTQPAKRRSQLDELLGILRVLPLDEAAGYQRLAACESVRLSESRAKPRRVPALKLAIPSGPAAAQLLQSTGSEKHQPASPRP